MGLALLNTIAVSVTARSNRVPVPISSQFSQRVAVHHAAVLATLHGYAVAFWWRPSSSGPGRSSPSDCSNPACPSTTWDFRR